MKINKKLSGILVSAVLALTILLGSVQTVFAAPKSITVDENEYNVNIEDYPSGINDIYAKFNTKRNDTDTYMLSFYDDTESKELMEAAFLKSGDNANKYEMLAMDIALYQEDSEGDYYIVPTAIEMTIICEVPSDFEGVEDKVKIFARTTSGGIETIPYTLVSVDDVICMQFTLKRFTQYAFAVTLADIDAYENQEYDDETVTAAPTKAPANPSPSKTPTKAPTTSNSSQNSSGSKDYVPQTGDDFSTETAAVTVLLGGSALIGLLWFAKKK